MVRGLFERCTDGIIDMRVLNADTLSYREKDIDKVLEVAGKAKRKKYGEICSQNRKEFVPFVCSADGAIGPEGKIVLKIISVGESVECNS